MADDTQQLGQTMPTPLAAADLVLANANAGKPRYSVAGDWSVGVAGDDVDQATVTIALATASGAANYADASPRHQTAKAAAMTPAGSLVIDVARPRGWIAPNQPYQGNASIPAVPTVTTLAPNTAAVAALPLTVTITGTGFTPFSTVKTGGSGVADVTGKYIDATHMSVAIFKASAGTVGVVVSDHDLDSASTNFTVT